MRKYCLVVVGLTLFGCGDLGSSGDVEGNIFGSAFEFVGGSAEGFGDAYTITLADTNAFACTNFEAPPTSYLIVVLDGINRPAVFDAVNVVTFSLYDDGVNVSEAAISGQVSIDTLDAEKGTISGIIDATGRSSDVTGSFTVSICQ